MNFLARRLLDGHEVRAGQTAMNNDVLWSIFGVPDDMNAVLLDTHATACRDDTTLLLLMPFDQLPFTLCLGIEVEVGAEVEVEDSEHTFSAPAA